MSNGKTLEFFFDFSSPWTYMAFTQVELVCEEAGATLVWKPFYVAAVFRASNHSVRDMRERPIPAKLAYYKADMQRWAERIGIRIGRLPVYGGGSKPLNSAAALRGALVALDRGRISQYARSVFRAYWEDLEDVSERDVLARLANDAGLDPSEFAERVDAPDIREGLRANTDEFVRRGGFGTPSFFVDGRDMFFGNDRLDFVREALK